MASELLFRTGAAADRIAGMVTPRHRTLYESPKPVNRTLCWPPRSSVSWGIAAGAAITAMHLAPVMFLQREIVASSVQRGSAQTLSFMSLRLDGQGERRYCVFRVYCVLIGWLILRSAFLPRLVGGADDLRGGSYSSA